MTTKFPVGGSRQAVYCYLRDLGFTMSGWSDKSWKNFYGVEVNIFGAGSMVRMGEQEFPLDELRMRVPRAADNG